MKVLSITIKLLILVAIVGVGILIYTTCSGAPLVQRIDDTKPDTTYLHQVATQTHLYYAERATANEDGSITMSGWYEHAGDKWVLHAGEITLPKQLIPRIAR